VSAHLPPVSVSLEKAVSAQRWLKKGENGYGGRRAEHASLMKILMETFHRLSKRSLADFPGSDQSCQ